MASFRKRSGAWQAVITRKGYPRISRTFDTRQEAEHWAATTESEMGFGRFKIPRKEDGMTLREAFDLYWSKTASLQKGAQKYASLIRKWTGSPLSERPLSSIGAKDVAEYRDRRLRGDTERGIGSVSPQTVIHELNILSRMFNTAIREWGMTDLVNPVRLIRKPHRPESRERRTLPDEIERICRASESPLLPSIVRFAVETGLRRSEIIGIRWENVHLKKRKILAEDTKAEGGRKISRWVPLSPKAVEILSSLPKQTGGRVWPMTGDAITQAYNRAVARARKTYENECAATGENPDPSFLTGMTFHDLRHEATSRFFEKGLNPMQVAAITGHKTLQMLKRYTHLKAEDLAEMLAKE